MRVRITAADPERPMWFNAHVGEEFDRTARSLLPPTRRMQISLPVPVRTIAGVVALLLGSTTPLVAQERLPSIPEGQSVRITSDLLPSRTVATFEGFRANTLLAVRRSGRRLSLPLSRIEALEVARKDRLTGALFGAPLGALALTTGLAIWAHSHGGWLGCHGCPFADDFVFSALFGVPIGGVAGAITGAVVGIKRWAPVPGFPRQR